MVLSTKGKKYPAEILTDDEVCRLIRGCSSRAPTGMRNRALIVVLYRGGLRISESLALLPVTVRGIKSTFSSAKLVHPRWPVTAS